jgi:integrase
MTERSPGVWRLRVFIGPDPATGNPRQATRTFKGTKRQAATALTDFVSEVSKGRAPAAAPASVTVAQLLEDWIDHITPTRSPTTIRGYKDKSKRINTKLGRVPLAKLTAQTLDRAYRGWLDEGLHPTTVHHLHGVLSAALHQAAKWGLVAEVATDRASPPPLRSKPVRVPGPEVIQRLIDAAEKRGQSVLAAAITVACTTGLRRGELLGLRWDDVDFRSRVLHVRRAVKHDTGPGWVIGPPKTHQERTISLDDFTLAVLGELRTRASSWAADACVSLQEDGYVLTFDPSGTEPMKPDSLGQAFGRLCRVEGIGDVTLHTLRHFSASVLIASGRDVRTVAGRLGHSDATTTLRVYSHMVEGRDRDAADFLGQLMSAGQTAALDQG